jgi:hypothetical protein
MKRIPLLVVALLLSASAASAATTTQKWTAGWDKFSEPLNYKTSNVSWSVNPTKRTLTVTYTLVGARPNKFYQVGIAFFCTTFPAIFDQFPTQLLSDGNCIALTRQDVTKTQAQVFFGAVLTNIHGAGSFTVVIGPVAAGTYDVEFIADDGAGCFLNGGGAMPLASGISNRLAQHSETRPRLPSPDAVTTPPLRDARGGRLARPQRVEAPDPRSPNARIVCARRFPPPHRNSY